MGTQGAGVYRRQRAGVGYFAEVHVDLDAGLATEVMIAPPRRAPELPGTCVVPHDRLTPYLEALRRGATVALGIAGARGAVSVCTLRIRPADSTQGAVAAASALAVWDALGFEPCAEVRASLDRLVFDSGPDHVPELESLLPTW